MGEYSDAGITLRWSEVATHAARGVQRVLVEAGPAVSPHDSLRLIYSIAGGAERAVRGWPLRCDPQTGMQHFAADLPAVAKGKTLFWRPVLSARGRDYGPARAETTPDAQSVAQKQAQTPAAPAKAGPESPALAFIARFVVPFTTKFCPTGETPDGLWLHFAIREGGTVTGPNVSGTIDPIGGDWMRVRPDGVGLLNARAMISPSSGGTPIMFEDSGICDFGSDGFGMLCKGKLPPTAPVRIASRYLTSNPDYTWINRVQGFGVGEAHLSDVTLRFDVYSAKGTSDA